MGWRSIDNLMLQWGSWDVLDAEEVEELQKLMDQYGDNAKRVIDDVLHGEGAEEIKTQIARLLPASGRRWKGKRAAATRAMPRSFEQDNELLSVTIAARGYYHYLYFPDDGSNTRKHAGNQQFMKRGAESSTDKIVEMCLGRLV